ncbi:MAG: glycerophosphodiester phosphodiesterase [Lachnospiraceae bacterium]|nr:glycerophosphodiester phosphodiesterase [Lachnospiraceae bacterium]
MLDKIKRFIRTILLAPVITGIGYLLMIMPNMTGRSRFAGFKKWLYAHRGLHDNESDAPENSLKAFAKAVDKGFGIELDVQMTKDGKIVVCHDFDLKRVCGVNKKIKNMTYDEISKYNILDSDSKIPLFSEVLEEVAGKVPLIIEYKLPSFDTSICEIVDEMLSDYKGIYMVESFHPMAVWWYKKNRPAIIRGILSSDYLLSGGTDGTPKFILSMSKNLLFNFIVKPDFVAYDCRYFSNPSRQLCKKLYRTPSVAWTIKSQRELDAREKDYDIFIFEGFTPVKYL